MLLVLEEDADVSSVRAVIVSLVLLTGLAGIVYPLLILGLAQAFFRRKRRRLVRRDGRIRARC